MRFKGFTFLEILVVLTLVSVLMGMAVPQFLAFFTKPQQSEYQHLSRVIKLLRNDAILRGTSYCLVFDVKQQQIRTTLEEADGKCSEETLLKPKTLKPHDFPEELILQQAVLVEKNKSSINSAIMDLEVHINRSGFVTPFSFQLLDKNSSEIWIIESEGIMGNLELKLQ